MLLECSNIKKSYQGIDVLKNVSFKVNDHDKIAIIGVNGAGKTTLTKIITQQEEADDGNLYKNKDLTIGYLSQNPEFDLNLTVYQVALRVFDHVIALETKLRELELEMAINHSSQIMAAYDRLQHQFNELNGYSYPSKISGVLKGLGFKKEEYDQEVVSLSGGQKTRLSLATLLLQEPNLLILDEPTNHLDFKAISFLETYLKGYNHGLIVISHDRYFINQVSNKIVEIENGKSYIYDGTYQEYAIKKQEIRNIALKHYLNQQKEIARIQKSIDTLKSYNREKSIKRANSKEKQLEKMKKIDRLESLPKDITMNFTPRIESGFDVLSIQDLSVSYDQVVFQGINLEIKRGSRVALLGENGIGKTTLFKTILKQLKPDTGKIKLGSHVEVAYYDQEHNNLSSFKTIFNEISDKFPRLTNTQIRSTLAMFNFTGDDVFKEIGTLSGGEKGRVSLSEILLTKANFLILDEPTNHLDIASKEVLEDSLLNFEGTIFFISHDRYFINKVATDIIELKNNEAINHHGSYDKYLLSNEEPKKEVVKKSKPVRIKQPSQRKLRDVEKNISKLEDQINQKENLLTSDEYVNDYIKYNHLQDEINELNNKLEELLIEWESLA